MIGFFFPVVKVKPIESIRKDWNIVKLMGIYIYIPIIYIYISATILVT